MIRLVPRSDTPALLQVATPVMAVLATMIAGGLLFALMGFDPVAAIRTIFWDPLSVPPPAIPARSCWSRPGR